jgi:hypothetical protein
MCEMLCNEMGSFKTLYNNSTLENSSTLENNSTLENSSSENRKTQM